MNGAKIHLTFYIVLCPTLHIPVSKVPGKEDDSFILTHFTLLLGNTWSLLLLIYFSHIMR